MIFSELIDTLRDEMHKKGLADKKVEFYTENRLGLELLSVHENNEDDVYINIGTDGDSKTQTAEKIILDWGRAGLGIDEKTVQALYDSI